MQLSQIAEAEQLAGALKANTRVIADPISSRDKWMRYYPSGQWEEIPKHRIIATAASQVQSNYELYKGKLKDEEDGEARSKQLSIYGTARDYYSTRRTAKAISGVIELAKPYLLADQSNFDAKPELLNCAKGVLTLVDGKATPGPHDSTLLLTKQSPITYDADAICPRWEKFISQVLVSESGKADSGLASYLRRLIGYIATGQSCEDLVALFYGEGCNGKSTFLSVLDYVLGDYAHMTDPSQLISRTASHREAYICNLQGTRLAWADEFPVGAQWAESAMKLLTGHTISARELYRMPFSFEACFTMCFAGNELPATADRTHGFWRRVRVIPFGANFDDEDKDLDLLEKLKAEGPGIMNWILKGYTEWYADGLGSCAAVDKSTTAYRDEQTLGTVAQFVEDMCAESDSSKVLHSVLYKAYEEWCAQNGFYRVGGRQLAAEVRRLGYKPEKQGYKGLKLA